MTDPMKAPRAGGKPARAWRPDDHSSHGRAARRIRRVKAAAAALALCTVVAAIAVFLWVLWRPRPHATLAFASRVIKSYDKYPPNAGAEGDEESLDRLFDERRDSENKSRQEWKRTADPTSDPRPSQRRAEPRTASISNERTLIVLWSGHAQVNPKSPAEIDLLTAREGGDDGSDERKPLATVLERLSHEDARTVVLCLDIGRLDPDWSYGIIARDAISLLPRQVDEALKNSFTGEGRPKLVVICSCSPGETSWVIPADEKNSKPQSAFVHYLKEALEGKCDGFEQGAERKNGAADGQITTQELVSFLTAHVREWAAKNRGVSQNVLVLPAQRVEDRKTVLAYLPDPSVKTKNRKTSQAADAKQSTEGAPLPEGEALADRTGSGGEKRPASDAKVAAKGAAPSGDPKDSKAPPADSQPAQKLDRLWSGFDVSWNNDDLLNVAPFRLRALHAKLIRAEQFLAAGLDHDSRYDTELRDAAELVRMLQSAPRSGVAAPPLASRDGSAASTEAERKAFDAFFKLLSQEAAPKPQAGASPPATAPDQAPIRIEDPVVAKRLIVWLFDPQSKVDAAQLKTFFKNLSQQYPELSGDWFLASKLAEFPGAWADPESPVPRPQAARLRFTASVLAAQLEGAPELFPVLKTQIEETFRAIRAIETWFVVKPSLNDASRYAQKHFNRAQELIAEIQRCIETHRKACFLRNRLLAELPEAARWMARRAEDPVLGDSNAGTLDSLRRWATTAAASQREWTFQSPDVLDGDRGANLLRLMADAVQLNNKLEQALQSTSKRYPTREMNELVNSINEMQLEQLKERTRQRFNSRSAETGRSDGRDRLSDFKEWHSLDVAMPLPWMAKGRESLRKKLATSSADTQDRAVAATTGGLWQAFWGIQTLALAGADPDALRAACATYERLVKAELTRENQDAKKASSNEKLVADRAALGQQLKLESERLTKLSATPVDASGANPKGFERAIRTLDDVQFLVGDFAVKNTPDGRTNTPDDWIHQGHRDQWLAQLKSFTTAQRGLVGEPDCRPARTGESTFGAEGGGRPRRSVSIDPPTLAFDQSNQSARLVISVKDHRETDGRFFAILDYNRDELNCSTDQAVTPSPGALVPLSSGGLQVTLSLRDRGATDRSPVSVALLEAVHEPDAAEERFLIHDVKRVDYTRPMHYDRWFVELATPDGDLPHQTSNGDESRSVCLPAEGGPYKLVPRLVRPEIDAAEVAEVEVDCYPLDSRGTRTEPPLCQKIKVKFPKGETTAKIDVGPAKGPPADARTQPAASAPPVKATIDVTNGLQFVIRPRGASSGGGPASSENAKQDHPFDIRFSRFWDPSTYIERPKVKSIALNDPTRATIDVPIPIQPNDKPSELNSKAREVSLFKDVFPIDLHVPDDLPHSGVTRNDEIKRAGSPQSLNVEIDNLRLEKRPDSAHPKMFFLSLDVGPWPHAYRYRCIHQAGEFRLDDVSGSNSIRIVTPLNFAVFGPKEKTAPGAGSSNAVDCKLEIGLPDQRSADRALQLRRQLYQVLPSGVLKEPPQDDLVDDRVVSSWKKFVGLARPIQGDWEFTTAIEDYTANFRFGGQGRFLLRAVLRDPKDGQAKLSDEVYFSVDRNPPRVLEPNGLQARYRPTDTLAFTVTAEDDESGIKSIVALLAKHATKRGTRDVSEGDVPLFREEPPPNVDGLPRKRLVNVVCAPEQRPVSGDYDLYVFVEDGAKRESLEGRLATITFVPPPPPKPAPSPESKKPGTLVVTFRTSGQCTLKLSDPMMQKQDRGGFGLDETVVFKKVVPGTYTLSWEGFYQGKFKGTESVTIEEGKEATISVGPGR